MSRNLFFFDIDGTILGNSRHVRPANLNAILALKKQGHLIFICSGRAPVSIDRSLKEAGFDGVIASAGSFIYVGKEKVFEKSIDRALLVKTLRLFEENEIYPTLETEKTVYQHPEASAMFIRIGQDQEKFKRCLPFLEKHYRIVMFDWFKTGAKSDYLQGELIQKSCTKGDAVRFLSEYYSIPITDTWGFGDSMNDFEMIQACGHSYVSTESPDELKKEADGFFLPPDEDGMEKLLKQLPL